MEINFYDPIQTTPFKLKTKLYSYLWNFINSTIFRYSPNFCRKYRVMLLKLFGADISWNSSIDRKALVTHPWNLIMGNFSSLGENTWAYCLDKIIIGDKCCIGKDVYLLTGYHDLGLEFKLKTKKILIGNGVWISTGSYILPGITIGDFSVVGANSTVTKDIVDGSVVAGNPAKLIKKRFVNG